MPFYSLGVRSRRPDYLIGVVNVNGMSVRPTERTQVAHHPTAVEEGMLLSALRAFVGRRGSDHFAGFVDAEGIAERPPRERAQILHSVERLCRSRLGLGWSRPETQQCY